MLIDPLTRLRLILKKYHNGMLIAEEDKKIIRQDYAQVYNYMPNNEHKAQYLKEVEKLFTLFGGREHVLLESNVTIQKSDRIQYR